MYLRFFNIFVRRVVAITWIVIGLIITCANLPLLLPGATIEIDGARTDDLVYRACAVLIPFLGVVAGVLFFRSKPYRPQEQ